MIMTIIDKTDLTALRKADSVCFDHNIRTTAGPERVSMIRAIKRAPYDTTDPFAQDVTHAINVDSRAFSYDHPSDSDNLTAFEMLHSAQVTETWQTIVGLLRVGDDLKLVWAAGNSNGYLEESNLHRDELRLEVTRNGKRLTFHVATSVCPNNSARMIKTLAYELT
jgi:hypothetical protein